MVRREEQPWQSRATLFLDTRRIGHRGSGPASSFEWAVSAAASIGVHLLRRGYSTRLVTDAGAAVAATSRESGPSADAEGLLLDALAVVGQSSTGQLSHASINLPRDGSHGVLIAVLGVLTPAEAEAMVRFRQRASSALAIVIDSPSWALGKERAPEEVAEQLSESLSMLRRGGWRVAVARAGEAIPQVWARLTLGEGASVGDTARAPHQTAAVAPDAAGTPSPPPDLVGGRTP